MCMFAVIPVPLYGKCKKHKSWWTIESLDVKCIQISSSEISKHSANRTRHFHCSLYTVRWLETSENRFEEWINIFVQGRVQKSMCGGWYWSMVVILPGKSEIYEGWLWREAGALNISLPSFHGYCIPFISTPRHI
jgi:hypothetical protein